MAIILAAALGLSSEVRLLAVASGSMEPTIPAGSLIVVAAKNNYIPGDIISFNEVAGNSVVTHRISRIEEVEDRIAYF